MDRLTIKRNEIDRKSNYTTDINNVYIDELDNGYKFATGKVIEKLGKYEDIEENIGVDLGKVFLALKEFLQFLLFFSRKLHLPFHNLLYYQ